MKIQPFSVFRTEDFVSQRDWIDKLFLPLNSVLSNVTQALSRQLDSENIPQIVKTFEGNNLTLPIKFQNTITGFTPTQMVIAQATKNGTPITMVGAWSYSGDTVTVSELFQITAAGNVALSSGTKFTVTIRMT